jgi:hypothetical protein
MSGWGSGKRWEFFLIDEDVYDLILWRAFFPARASEEI